MKSSRPGSAHWRSSKTRTAGSRWRSARRTSARRRTARRASERRVAASRAGRAGRARSSAARSRRARTPASVAAIRSRVVASSSVSARPARRRTISPSAQNVMPSPIRRRAALVPVDRLEDAVDVLQELPGEAALADAGLAGDGQRGAPALARRGMEEVLEQAQLVVAAHERASRPSDRPWPPRLATTRRARQAGTGAVLPLSTCSPAASKTMARAGRSLGRLADEDRAGRRDGLQPAGGVDEVAGDHPWPVAPRVTAASPVRTPGAGLEAAAVGAAVRGRAPRRPGRAPPGRPAPRRPRGRPACPRRPSRRRR